MLLYIILSLFLCMLSVLQWKRTYYLVHENFIYNKLSHLFHHQFAFSLQFYYLSCAFLLSVFFCFFFSSFLYFHLKIFMGARRAREVIVCCVCVYVCEILFWDQPRWSFYYRFDKFRTFALLSWKFLLCRFLEIILHLKIHPYIITFENEFMTLS